MKPVNTGDKHFSDALETNICPALILEHDFYQLLSQFVSIQMMSLSKFSKTNNRLKFVIISGGSMTSSALTNDSRNHFLPDKITTFVQFTYEYRPILRNGDLES